MNVNTYVAISSLRIRSADENVNVTSIIRQRLTGSPYKFRPKDTIEKLDTIRSMRQQSCVVDVEPAMSDYGISSSAEEIELPSMVSIADDLQFMGPVKVKLFKQVMGTYKPQGTDNDANQLTLLLDDPSKEGEILHHVSLIEAKEFAERLYHIKGTYFRIATENEILTAKRVDQTLTNSLRSFPIWTEDIYPPIEGESGNATPNFVILLDTNQFSGKAEDRIASICLVMDQSNC
ncbi:hypothetical protein A2230_05710 [candidate division WOR-1 bacterium RIFOXYA2_FULL_36_21]|uniref:Uncharacterized protein n=1 Tax=candidate division WOR-1 bacterium RIFOXYB2_FULL_36_35 TaxID=1802578 RepID=A0A1F4S8W9_UNCSA|nr:MAG: hypothetical protein A2230_05710 [candidate division WOR-1 bacterium RIFOXYA2_FULL_36_21]OGC16852.1 MAG: hypothetical protein A2290_04995 [candidate division WOR-1 bacterium RIFOXYB2_FULL_36_35]OGC18681.1 MAG: hypothetical protein A2282_07215 [candidate division WOR-1 bacterium RIFOXYA12_FULL_36_13]